jgi:hypothetical protein
MVIIQRIASTGATLEETKERENQIRMELNKYELQE